MPLEIILVRAPQFAGYTRPQHKTFALSQDYCVVITFTRLLCIVTENSQHASNNRSVKVMRSTVVECWFDSEVSSVHINATVTGTVLVKTAYCFPESHHCKCIPSAIWISCQAFSFCSKWHTHKIKTGWKIIRVKFQAKRNLSATVTCCLLPPCKKVRPNPASFLSAKLAAWNRGLS